MTVNQLNEMVAQRVTLFVPQAYHNAYPATHKEQLMNMKEFLLYILSKQN